MDEDIELRLKRIYAALGLTSREWKPSDLRVTSDRGPKHIGVTLDFGGGVAEEELANRVHSTIHNIASLRDHLKKWAKENRKEVARVDDAFFVSKPLRLITDIWNLEKHASPERNGGYSGLSPHLGRIMPMLQASGPGASFVFSLKDGSTSTSGDLRTVIEAEVLDGQGKPLGQLSDLASKAVNDWERLLKDL